MGWPGRKHSARSPELVPREAADGHSRVSGQGDCSRKLRRARCRAAASPTAPSRRPTGRARSAATAGSSRRRSIPAAAARRAASSCAATTTRSRTAADELLGTQAGHPADRPARQAGLAALCRGGRDIGSASSISASCSTANTERVMVVASARPAAWRSRRSRTSSPRPSSGSRSSPAVGMQAFQAREIAFGARPRAGADRSKRSTTILGCYRAFRELDATMVEINPLVVTEDRHIARARRQDDLRRQRAVPPAADRRAARQVQEDPRETHAADRGLSYVGLEGDIGCIVNGAGLAMATHGHDQARRRRARQLPRHRRRRHARARGQVVQAGAARQERQGDPGQHLRRHQPLRLGRQGRGQGGRRSSPQACPSSSGSPAPMSRRAARSSPRAA